VVYGGGLRGREAEAGWWYIDVERVEDGDPTKDARRQTPAPVRLGASRAEH
jgi:hypothetical protein